MIGRRQLFGAAAMSLAVAHTMHGELAAAAAEVAKSASPEQAADSMHKMARLAPRGTNGRLVRLGTLNLESQQDFTMAFRQMQAQSVRKASMAALDRVLEAEGVDPATPITVEEMRALVEKDPAIGIAAKTWLANQQITWKTLQDYFHANADQYLSEMESTDKTGPGALVLSPNMNIPEYTRHEIHIQPGGYVGDPFAGHMYLYGTNSFYYGNRGSNEQDEIHRSAAAKLPVPKDGKVRRILDMGCGVGQYTVALKERFPDAEVWGIDIGGPMVRFAHMRAAKLGIGANFAQKLAEDTGFPDGHFDIVSSYIIHHELPAQKTLAVIDEARRVTRPGGVYYPLDFNSGGTRMPAHQMYGRWWDHRWNNEVWSFEYHSVPFSEEIGKRGFTEVKPSVALLQGFGARHFVRVA
ncbi:MAG: class I SAM-dependent methyltransferase [Steroidobacteraceae bacterium]|nr:class I SAM-dependent methyltransferase [Nevskiaceae bacterium]MCP5359236.1 class I SAM-dependent methyltransferase [Nevskiaceae bacterium]MCP5466470.1 class I SAM-dependent methyltransferase [Nevskiaceae bacterium]MCP5471829.1 class I SAM-dependent methyltransferase [Nevskiaceae bacterium]